MLDPIDQIAVYYSNGYYIVLSLICLFVWATYNPNNKFINQKFGFWLATAIVIFLAFRPLTNHYGFGDTKGYAFFFNLVKTQSEVNIDGRDLGFEWIQFQLRYYEVWVLFLVMGAIYCYTQLYACKKLVPLQYGFLFLIVVASFSFWGYGVNGMRNGAAMGLVMLAFTTKKLYPKIILYLLAYSLHGSALLPICAFSANYFYSNSKTYLKFWCVCLVLSFFVSNMLTEVLNLNDLLEDKRTNYLSGSFDSYDGNPFSSTGYRWDFVLYGIVPIIIGYKYIAQGNANKVYQYIYNAYLLCNAFWLFTIYVPYNNRFAYLSWFLYPILTAYPYLTNYASGKNIQYRRNVLILTFLFTIVMHYK